MTAMSVPEQQRFIRWVKAWRRVGLCLRRGEEPSSALFREEQLALRAMKSNKDRKYGFAAQKSHGDKESPAGPGSAYARTDVFRNPRATPTHKAPVPGSVVTPLPTRRKPK